MKKWLFNPFTYVAGTKALFTGWAIMLATAWISYHSNCHFDGVLDMHIHAKGVPLQVYFWEQLIDWSCAAVLFYIAGLIFSTSRIRFIDLAGTMALARWPMIISAIVAFGLQPPPGAGNMHNIEDIMRFLDANIWLVCYTLFIMILSTIWLIALMYNAFKVSCNIKEARGTAIFVTTLLIAEILAHVISTFFINI